MKKFILIIPCKLTELEARLNALSLSGLHLSEIRYPNRFIFVKGEPKNIHHIILYSALKEYGLLRWRNIFLSSNLRSNELKKNCLTNYTIIQVRENLPEELKRAFHEDRLSYIHTVYRRRFWSSIFGYGLAIIMMGLDYGNTQNISIITILIIALLVALVSYNLYGIVSIKNKIRA